MVDGGRKRPRSAGSSERVVSIVDRIEARQIAELRRLASKAHVRELEAAIEWLDWKKQLEAQDFDTAIARAARADTAAARREAGQLRCLRALQRCLKGDAETGRAEWAEIAAEVPDLALPHLFLARWVAQRDPRAALAHFDRAAEIEPRDANVYWRRGECHERLGDHERAIANFRTAHALDPSSVDGLYAMGKALVMLGKPAEAIRYYDEAISRAPRYVDFYSSRAIALEVTGDHAAAVRDYDRVLELDPQNAAARYSRARCRACTDDVERAIEELSALVAEAPDVGVIHLTLGKALFKAERFEAAREALSRAVELVPDEHEAWAYRSLAKVRLDDRDGAAADVARAVEIAPDRPDYVYALVSIRHTDDPAALVAALEEPIARFPGLPFFLEERAEAYEKQRETELALADYERLVAAWPEQASFRVGRARSLSGLGRLDEGLEEAERAVAADPTLSLAYGMRAHIRCQLAGDDALVGADWARALELAPDDAATIYHRGLWLAEKERYAAAFDDFDRAVRLAPSLAQAYFQRGYARYRLDDEPPEGAWLETAEEIDARFGACIDDFERAIALGYEDEDVFAQLHWSHKCLDDDAKALEALDRGLALDPRRHDLLMLREDLRRELGDEAGAEADRLLREEVEAAWKVEEEAEAAAMAAGMTASMAAMAGGPPHNETVT